MWLEFCLYSSYAVPYEVQRDNMPTAFDFVSLPIPHPIPDCGMTGLHPLRDLVASNRVVCTYCQQPIDVGSKEWRAFIDKAADLYRTIMVPR